MQPIFTTQRVMMWYSMCPADESLNAFQKRSYIAFTLVALLALVFSVAASFAFCWKFTSCDFNGSVYALMTAIVTFGMVLSLLVAILMRHQIGSIFVKLSTIYRARKFNEL